MTSYKVLYVAHTASTARLWTVSLQDNKQTLTRQYADFLARFYKASLEKKQFYLQGWSHSAYFVWQEQNNYDAKMTNNGGQRTI